VLVSWPCPGFVWDPAGASGECGQFAGHDGPCVPFTPGEYLREPRIHPLDLRNILLSARVCPDGHRYTSVEMHVHGFDYQSGALTYVLLTFEPCNCRFRWVDPDTPDL
jgi:hypothetical protein